MLTRRSLLTGVLGASVACQRSRRPADGKIHLRFTTWGSQAEIDAFQHVIAKYEAKHPKVAIDLEEMAYRSKSSIDVELAAGVGPDVFRVEYIDVGRYSPSGAILDITPYVPRGFGEAFTQPIWAAVQYAGRPHAFPHHTDTSAILYSKTIFKRLGIQPPRELEESWTWEEFIDVSQAIKRSACDYAFAVNWNYGGAFRWLNFLYQHDGCLLRDDAKVCALPSDAAYETLRWTQSFFTRQLVPPGDGTTSTEEVENLFSTGVVGMYFDVGPQGLRDLGSHMDWGTTFLPRDVRFAAELGGNAVAVTRDAKHPEIAADFAMFVTNEENMREFVLAAEFLPVRRKLLEQPLPYPYKPDEMRVHLEQSATVPVDLARTVTLPRFPRVARTLGDELDAAFTGGQSAEVTLNRLTRAVRRSLQA